jgi:hypothetical protein
MFSRDSFHYFRSPLDGVNVPLDFEKERVLDGVWMVYDAGVVDGAHH